jgi:general stress protein 26
MSDLKEKIYEKMKEHTLASFATIAENGKPWTRYVVVKADDQLNIWFATFLNSRKTLQIAKNAEVHLTLGISDPQTCLSSRSFDSIAQRLMFLLSIARHKISFEYRNVYPFNMITT